VTVAPKPYGAVPGRVGRPPDRPSRSLVTMMWEL